MKKLISLIFILFSLSFSFSAFATSDVQQDEYLIIYEKTNVAPNVDPGPLYGPNDPADPNAPIDSNLYVLLFAALCYGVYQRKRLSSLGVRGKGLEVSN
jgi:hypothetical protein